MKKVSVLGLSCVGLSFLSVPAMAETGSNCNYQASTVLEPAAIKRDTMTTAGFAQHYQGNQPLLDKKTRYIGFQIPEGLGNFRVFARSNDGVCLEVTSYFLGRGHELVSKAWGDGSDPEKEYPSISLANGISEDQWMSSENGSKFNAKRLSRPDLSGTVSAAKKKEFLQKRKEAAEKAVADMKSDPRFNGANGVSSMGGQTSAIQSSAVSPSSSESDEFFPLFEAALGGSSSNANTQDGDENLVMKKAKNKHAHSKSSQSDGLGSLDKDSRDALVKEFGDGKTADVASYESFMARDLAGAYAVHENVKHENLASVREHNLREKFTTEKPFWYDYAGGHFQLFITTHNGSHHYITDMKAAEWPASNPGMNADSNLMNIRSAMISPNRTQGPAGTTNNSGIYTPPPPVSNESPLSAGGTAQTWKK